MILILCYIKEQYIPEKLGYPIGGTANELKYFYIQWHLENDEMLESMYFVFFKVKCKNFKIK